MGRFDLSCDLVLGPSDRPQLSQFRTPHLGDVLTLPLSNPAATTPILKTAGYEGGARLSPDGKWMTYISNESGQNEVYLRPYSGAERRWQVSTQGGIQAVWNPNGKEIFYRNADKMMVVEVSMNPDVVLSRPHVLFDHRYAFGAGITIANYDVARDGQRFAMIKDEATAGRLHIVVNWLSDLTRLASAGQPLKPRSRSAREFFLRIGTLVLSTPLPLVSRIPPRGVPRTAAGRKFSSRFRN